VLPAALVRGGVTNRSRAGFVAGLGPKTLLRLLAPTTSFPRALTLRHRLQVALTSRNLRSRWRFPVRESPSRPARLASAGGSTPGGVSRITTGAPASSTGMRVGFVQRPRLASESTGSKRWASASGSPSATSS
jgi:hypothetical protein